MIARLTAAALALVAVAASPPAYAAPLPTSTAVTISIPQSAYGQPVTATATATAPTASGLPDGDMVFSVDGLAFKTNLGASGVSTLVLPAAPVGQHEVSATFVPRFPEAQQGSTSATQTWVVTPVRTRLQVRVIGKGARIPTSVQVKAAGDFGTRPSGRVKVVVRRLGTRGSARSVARLDAAAVVRTDLGRLRQGRYRLEVTYVGDSQHLRRTQSEKFFVRRR